MISKSYRQFSQTGSTTKPQWIYTPKKHIIGCHWFVHTWCQVFLNFLLLNTLVHPGEPHVKSRQMLQKNERPPLRSGNSRVFGGLNSAEAAWEKMLVQGGIQP